MTSNPVTAKRELNEVELLAFDAARRSQMPFRSYADNSDCVWINGRPHCPDFVFFHCILAESDGFFIHNEYGTSKRDQRMQEDVDAHNAQRKKEIELYGKSDKMELHLLRFWAHDVKADPWNNFIIPIKNYAKAKGII